MKRRFQRVGQNSGVESTIFPCLICHVLNWILRFLDGHCIGQKTQPDRDLAEKAGRNIPPLRETGWSSKFPHVGEAFVGYSSTPEPQSPVAQLVEQVAVNHLVTGSSPVGGALLPQASHTAC